MTVLVTDGSYKNSLAIIRTLGEKNIQIYSASKDRKSLCSYSKYCKKAFLYPHPRHDPQRFIQQIINILKKNEIDVLMPVGVAPFTLFSKHKDELEKYTRVPVASYDKFQIAHDKAKANELAVKNNVPAPLSFNPKTIKELKSSLKELQFPLVIKARKGTSSNQIRYANNKDEAITIWNEFEKLAKDKNRDVIDYSFPLVQEYLPGEIVDVVFVFNEGKIRGCLTQKRILTMPVRGGSGALNITTFDKEAARYGVKLMKALKWHGVGMVEFKRDINGTPKLLEINPKFWGTSELSISAGLNFPYMLYKIAMDGDTEANYKYLYPKKFGWPLPMGVKHLFETNTPVFTFKEYMKLFAVRNGTDIRLLDDPNPLSLQFQYVMRFLIARMLKTINLRK